MKGKAQAIRRAVGLSIIVNSSGDWWSNEDGWTDNIMDATTFTEEEREKYSLPIGGLWASATEEISTNV